LIGRLGLVVSVITVEIVDTTAYSTRDLAAFDGFRYILENRASELERFEFSFVVIMARNWKSVAYQYSIAERGSDVQATLQAARNLPIRAFCHTHTASGSKIFGYDDKQKYYDQIKKHPVELTGVALYLMNYFRDVQIARGLEDLPEGKLLPFQSYKG
jgi:hypothetical protein